MVCSKIDKGLMSGSNKILWRLKPIYNIEILTKPGQGGVRYCLHLKTKWEVLRKCLRRLRPWVSQTLRVTLTVCGNKFIQQLMEKIIYLLFS